MTSENMLHTIRNQSIIQKKLMTTIYQNEDIIRMSLHKSKFLPSLELRFNLEISRRVDVLVK